MPKMKTKKAISARFRLTGTGKLKRGRPGRRHLLTKKSSKRKRSLARAAFVAPGLLKKYKILMGV